jgi:hypothetical protein
VIQSNAQHSRGDRTGKIEGVMVFERQTGFV